jgi:hypothetical protein
MTRPPLPLPASPDRAWPPSITATTRKTAPPLLDEAEAVSRAARDTGVRVAFGWPFFDANPLVYGDHAVLARFFPPDRRAAIATMDQGLRSCATNMALFERARRWSTIPLPCIITPWRHNGPSRSRWRPSPLLRQQAAARAHPPAGNAAATRVGRCHFPQGFVPWLDAIGLLSPRLDGGASGVVAAR